MILVTGASEGIGLACARELLERTPHAVAITGREAHKLARARAALPAGAEGRLHCLTSDQSCRADVDALLERIATAPSLEGAVLGVGVNPLYAEGARRLHTLDPDTIDATVRTNCTHAFLLTRALLARFHAQRHGVLVWIGSRAAAGGMRGATLYCATKSFLSGLAHAAHAEYAGNGVRVHLVHPGVVRTPRTERHADAFAERHGLRVAEAGETARAIVDVFLDGDPDSIEMSLT